MYNSSLATAMAQFWDGSTPLVFVPYPSKVWYDSGSVDKTLYHHEAHSDDCRLEKLPKKQSREAPQEAKFIILHTEIYYSFNKVFPFIMLHI